MNTVAQALVDDDEAAMPASVASLPVADSRHAARTQAPVLEETPVALVYNGISHSVMLATPEDLDDFAVGFSIGEQVVAHAREVFSIEVIARSDGVEVAMQIDGAAMWRLKHARRARTGKTGCGLCGIDSLAQFDASVPRLPGAAPIAAAAMHRAMAALPPLQRLHRLTGAAHAAAWANRAGELLLVREDIGRHNALDKLIGAMARAGIDPRDGFAVITSRASFEMVQKAARAGIGHLAAVSAPSALAIRTADAAGLTLIGFVRNGAHSVYSVPDGMVDTR